jgi:hypothetical protein
MRPARGLGDRAGLAAGCVEFVQPGIGVGLQDAGIAGQMPLRVVAAFFGRAIGAATPEVPQGCTQGRRPASSSAMILSVISS